MEKTTKTPNHKKRLSSTASLFKFLLIGLLLLTGCGNNHSKSHKSEEPELFSNYKTERSKVLDKLSPKEKQLRNSIILDLEKSEIYSDLIKKKIVDQKYLVLLEAIGEGTINYTENKNFAIKEGTEKAVSEVNKGMKFVIDVIRLGIFGGVNDDILKVFTNYSKEFGISGTKGDIKYDSNGKEKYILNRDFTLIQFLATADSKNHEILNNYYESIASGKIDWLDEQDSKYIYGFLADKYSFNNYLKQNYPESKYLVNYSLKINATELYSEYDANEVSADEKYKNKKLAVTGIIKDIGVDITDNAYITLQTGNYGVIQCSFLNKSDVTSLHKDEKLTVVGLCSGKTLGNIILIDSVIF